MITLYIWEILWRSNLLVVNRTLTRNQKKEEAEAQQSKRRPPKRQIGHCSSPSLSMNRKKRQYQSGKIF